MGSERFADIFIRPQAQKMDRLIDKIDEFMFESDNRPWKPLILKGEYNSFRPSMLGKAECVRKLVYEYTNAEFENKQVFHDPQLLRIFKNGKDVHTRLQKVIGKLHAWTNGSISLLGKWECSNCKHVAGTDKDWQAKPKKCNKCKSEYFKYIEIEIVDEDNKIVGHCDGVIQWDKKRYLLEIKSVNPFSFPKITEVPDKFGYREQLALYMYLTGIKETIYIMENKGNQELKEFRVKYDSKIIKPVLAAVKDALNYIDKEELPPRILDEYQIKKTCGKCEYFPVCYQSSKFGYNLRIK